jgi:hypothetical protein
LLIVGFQILVIGLLADLIGLDREYIDESFRTRGLPTSDEPLAAVSGWSVEEKDDVYRLE